MITKIKDERSNFLCLKRKEKAYAFKTRKCLSLTGLEKLVLPLVIK